MEIFFTKIVSIIIAPVLFFAGIMGIGQDQNLGAVIPTSVALFETSLANSISSTATSSMTLVSATTKDGTTLATGTYAFIIDEGTASEEFVTATCVATACTSLTRGLSVLNGTSTIASLQKVHRRGASVKITDAPQLLILSRILNGNETVPNLLKYTTSPTITTSNSIVDKNYVDATSTLLRNELTTASTTADTHIARTDNPHSVTKTQVSLGNVTDNKQVKATTTSTVGVIPVWDSTSGDLLKDGYTVGTSSSNLVQLDGSSKLPAVDGSNLLNLPSGFADPMTAIGDIIYRNTSNTTDRLPRGATSTVLTSTGTSTVWAASPGEWTYYDKLDPSNSSSTQQFATLPLHDEWKVRLNLGNVNASDPLQISLTLNNVSSSTYAYNSQLDASPWIATANGQTGFYITLQNAFLDALYGEIMIQGKPINNNKNILCNISKTIASGNNKVCLRGGMNADNNNVSSIEIKPDANVEITGHIELWYKDNKI